jgi:hypothetical protein
MCHTHAVCASRGDLLGDAVALRDGCLPDYADFGERDSTSAPKLSCKLLVDGCNRFARLVSFIVDGDEQTLATMFVPPIRAATHN